MKLTALNNAVIHQKEPRFGRIVPASTMDTGLAKLSHSFFTLSDRLGKRPSLIWGLDKVPLIKWVDGAVKGVISTLLQVDCNDVPNIKIPFKAKGNMGPIGIAGTRGLFSVLTIFMVGGRVGHALKRAMNGDYREVRDILIRDIPTVSTLVFLYPLVIAKQVIKLLEKTKGIQLFLKDKNEALKYSELEDVYRILDKNRLTAILGNKSNHRGVIRALDGTLKNKALTTEMIGLLQKFKAAVQEGIQAVVSNGGGITPKLETASEKAFGFLQQLDARRLAYNNALATGEKVLAQPVLKKFNGWFRATVPAFNEMFVRYAKNSMVWGDAFGLLLSIGILGFGIPWFNQWFTETEYEKLKRKKAKAQKKMDAAQRSNPFSMISPVFGTTPSQAHGTMPPAMFAPSPMGFSPYYPYQQ